jgi:hypothetical protein
MLIAPKVHHLRRVGPPPEAAIHRLWRTRQTFSLALLAWLREQPPADDVALEVDASVSIVRQLARLMGSTP